MFLKQNIRFTAKTKKSTTEPRTRSKCFCFRNKYENVESVVINNSRHSRVRKTLDCFSKNKLCFQIVTERVLHHHCWTCLLQTLLNAESKWKFSSYNKRQLIYRVNSEKNTFKTDSLKDMVASKKIVYSLILLMMVLSIYCTDFLIAFK